ncbi:hypothetical protein J6590_034238 [Homalodisca vitripennis]|nr:hypothetical protein J6590_034238 [Homalodisca vitripennis]
MSRKELFVLVKEGPIPEQEAGRGASCSLFGGRYCCILSLFYPSPRATPDGTGPVVNRRQAAAPRRPHRLSIRVKLTLKRRVIPASRGLTIARTKYFPCLRVEGVLATERGVFLVCRYITIRIPPLPEGYYGLC